MSEPIRGFQGEFRWLSNFFKCPVVYDGVTYPSAEHAYQAAKTLDPGWRWKIRSAITPGRAKRLGRDPQLPLRPGWEERKTVVMRKVLQVKFQDRMLRAALLSTGDREIIEENTWGDRFWGTDLKGEGLNHLDRLLMELRAELRSER